MTVFQMTLGRNFKLITHFASHKKIKMSWIGNLGYTNVSREKGLLLRLFTNLVGWHTGIVSFPLSDVILAQLACPLSDIVFCLHSGITNLSLYKHWVIPKTDRKTCLCINRMYNLILVGQMFFGLLSFGRMLQQKNRPWHWHEFRQKKMNQNYERCALAGKRCHLMLRRLSL